MSGRQLIVCCDGTNNTLTGGTHDTNVLLLYEALRRGADPRQVLYYDPGVGAPDALPATDPTDWLRSKSKRLWGLASGQGIYDNIAQAYAFLCREWRPGDTVWLFGFSRGAFTARAVSGMVHLFGLVEARHEVLLPLLLRVYFTPTQVEMQRATRRVVRRLTDSMRRAIGIEPAADAGKTRNEVAEQIRRDFGRDARVHFVGVWDTVASVGLPGMSAQIPSDPTVKGKRIDHVRHALALDEHRRPFRLRLYADDEHGTPVDAQSMRQRWFRGAHGDVGGGYPLAESALPVRTLRWLFDEARSCGLHAQATALPPAPDARPPLAHDQRYVMPWWALVPATLRDTGRVRRADGSMQPVVTSSDETAAVDVPTVWRQLRSRWPMAFAAGGLLVFAVLHGALLGESPPIDSLAVAWYEARSALGRGAALALAQLQALPAALTGGAAAVWQPYAGRPLGAALLVDGALAASLAYLLARGTTWSWAKLAGQRRPGAPMPSWHRLGGALSLGFFADLAENTATWCAVASDGGAQGAASVVVGAAALAKWVGYAGALVLIALGAPRRR
jgi:uncharacterized protein (DUF2235 family)